MEQYESWANLAYRILVVALLGFIAWQQVAQRKVLESIDYSTPTAQQVQDVRIVNDSGNRVPVDAEISLKTSFVGGVAVQESLPVKVTNDGLTESIPVHVRPF